MGNGANHRACQARQIESQVTATDQRNRYKKGRSIGAAFLVFKPFAVSRSIDDILKDETGKFNDEFFQSCIFLQQCVNVRMVVVVAWLRR